MDFKSLVKIAIASGNRIDTYWRNFAAINVVIVGWRVSVGTNLSCPLCLGLCLVYLLGSLTSMLTLIRSYVLFQYILLELKAKLKDASLTEKSNKLISRMGFKNRIAMTISIHIVMACAILYLVIK